MKKFSSDKLREECGIFGISNHVDSSAMVALGLHALQHRGQEGCGIVSFDGKNFHSEKKQGLVSDHFTKLDVINKLPGEFAIGHNRYSTTGETYRQLMYAERQRQRRFASIVLNYNFGKQQKKKWSKGSFSGRSSGMGGGMDMDY